jgi:hypothetical protein
VNELRKITANLNHEFWPIFRAKHILNTGQVTFRLSQYWSSDLPVEPILVSDLPAEPILVK